MKAVREYEKKHPGGYLVKWGDINFGYFKSEMHFDDWYMSERQNGEALVFQVIRELDDGAGKRLYFDIETYITSGSNKRTTHTHTHTHTHTLAQSVTRTQP
jgi:hypothetical protein